MYEDFFGLSERPFTLIPDPDFLYLSPQHKLARSYLEYGITSRLGFVVLTGDVGTGKTTLIKAILRATEARQRIGVLYQTSLGAEDLLELLLREFGVRGHLPNRAARLAAFNQFLQNAHRRGEHVILIVDEAQNLGSEALEELRLLSNVQTDKELLLQGILVGQPNLRERLRHPGLSQLAQRVGVHYHLQALDLQETKEYIRYRLARAGGSGIFSETALENIYQVAKGVPRVINTWCDLALVAAFAEGLKSIDEEFIAEIIAIHGETLKAPEVKETTGDLGPPEAPPDKQEFWSRWSHYREADAEAWEGHAQALQGDLRQIGERLTRLETLVLDLTHQMIPALTKILAGQGYPEGKTAGEENVGEIRPGEPSAPAEAEEESPVAGAGTPPRRWWTKIRRS